MGLEFSRKKSHEFASFSLIHSLLHRLTLEENTYFCNFKHDVKYIYNRKKIVFVVSVDDNRRIQINAFPCTDNGKQVEEWIIFFSSFHKA